MDSKTLCGLTSSARLNEINILDVSPCSNAKKTRLH